MMCVILYHFVQVIVTSFSILKYGLGQVDKVMDEHCSCMITGIQVRSGWMRSL